MKSKLVESVSKPLCGMAIIVASFVVWSLLFPISTLAQKTEDKYKTIHVKFKEQFSPKSSLTGSSARSGVGEMDKVSEKHKALSIRRIFPDAAKYEKAHRAFGLHLWYEIKLPADASLNYALTDYRNLDYFNNVEECQEYTAVHASTTINNLPELPSGTNDPHFSKQWHYHNTGQTEGTPGADINLLKAWQIQTGSSNVIVAVIDGGIYQNHPDLAGALWTNAGEIPANKIDDDHNGYVDDIHGYGFGDRSSTIEPDGHGTHVAGTIGAVSNNGIGVSGIAGGSGTGDGVRLMSCAGFGAFRIGGFEEAMVYAADNGAVISQNSWRGGSSAIEAAIDYFVSRAGYDNSSANFSSNIQTGPMAGGLVIFAAGNSNTNDPRAGYPGSYEKAIAVGSTDHNDRRSDFSNYGNWVDIAAPGSNVYSTIASSKYGYLSGTSMACPHVSGVAALVISHIQRKGLKPSEVWNRLKLSAQPVIIDGPGGLFPLGAGRVDALGALHEPDAIPPGAIADLHVSELNYSSLILQWTANGADGVSGQAAEYELRYSTAPINTSNFADATLFSNAPIPPPSGQQVTAEILDLSLETTYYFAIKSKDLFNNFSSLSNVVSVTTLSPPTPDVITAELSEQLYSGGTSTREVSIRNTGGDELLIRIGVPDLEPAPVGFPTGSTGRLFAIHPLTNTIKELNAKDGAVIASISMPQASTRNSEGLAFDGENLYYGSRSKIFKLNAETGDVVRSFTISGLTEINGLAWSGRYLYVSDRSTYGTYEVDTDNGTIRKRMVYSSGGSSFGGDTGTLFISETGHLTEIDVTTESTIRYIYHSLGENVRAFTYSSLDNILFISDGSSQLRALDATTGDLKYVLPFFATTALASDEYKQGWLSVKDQVVTIQPGETTSIPITFVATDLPAGQWSGTLKAIPVNVASNPVSISATLNVTSASDIQTASEIDLGTQFLGFPVDTLISLDNRGSSDLIITSIQANDVRVIPSLTSATLTPGQKIPLTVGIVPSGIGVINATITFSSNDPDEAVLTIPVKATISLPPAIEITPETLSTTMSTGESRTLNFTATNTGSSVLHWKADLSGATGPGITQSSFRQSNFSDEVTPVHQNEMSDFKVLKSSPVGLTCLAADPESGDIYAKGIGNSFYRYSAENDEWTLIGSAPSSAFGQGAWLEGKIYYGGLQLSVYTIQSNSWITLNYPFVGETGNLTSDGQYIYVVSGVSLYRYSPTDNTWQPLASLPRSIGGPYGGLSYHNGVIYAHEDETSGFTGDNRSYLFKYYISSDTWITTIDVPTRPSSGSAIDPSGRKYYVLCGARLSVLDMSEGEWKHLEAPFEAGTMSGLVYVGKPGFSGVYFIQGSDTGFCRYETSPSTNWISVTPPKGDLAPGSTQTFNVVVDAKGVDNGVYTGNLRVRSDHPAIEAVIPLTVTVNGAPDIVLQPTTFDAGEVRLGFERGLNLTVKNTGSAPLSVTSVTVDRPDFKVSIPSFTIQTGESIDLNVAFTPSSIGVQTGTFTFVTNDPDEGSVQFVYKGKGVAPPIPGITPASLNATLLSGASTVRQVAVSNTGGSNMDYAVDYDYGSTWFKGFTYGILAPGETKTVDITIDASGKPGGTYVENLRLTVHGEDVAEVPVTITVTGATDIFTSKKSIAFGDKFVDGEYDSTIQITNNGVLPLAITSITSNNPAFSISVAAPLNLSAGQSVDAIVSFRPTNLGPYNGQITFISNDPDEGAYVVPVSGTGIDSPIMVVTDTLAATAGTNESQTLDLIMTNSGGSVLKWAIKEMSSPQPSSVDGSAGREEPMAAGNFTLLNPAPPLLKWFCANPTTNSIYGFDTHYRDVYKYNVESGYWNAVGETPDLGSAGGGSGAFMGSKLYLVQTNNATTINVYNSTIDDWTTIPNGLGIGTSTITTDGTLLYLAGGGQFKSLDPKTGTWTDLPIPTIVLNGNGGLSYFNGFIYAHEGNGKGFAKYSIATATWENLISLPGDGMMGSAIDPVRKRYYAYGLNGSNFLYEYDITSNLWNVLAIPFFEVGNGGIAYSNNSGIQGIYILQGSKGQGFARYEPRNELTWLRASVLNGEISPSESQGIGINFNAFGLSPGTYAGSLEINSNEPNANTRSIPVSFRVTTPPTIEATEKISVKVDRLDLHSVQLKIQNKGVGSLQWNFTDALPPLLTANKVSGEISALTAEDIQVTFDPRELAPGTYFYVLDITSNDPVNKNVWTLLEFNVVDNHAPIVSLGFADQKLKVATVQVLLTGSITDPDNDPLIFSASSSNNNIVTAEVSWQMLKLHPIATGTTTVTVTARDIFDSSASTTFDVIVDQVVAVEEVEKESLLVAIPNPFDDAVTFRYYSEKQSTAELLVLDVSGKVVWRSGEYVETRGENEIVLNSAQFSPGVYSCHLFRSDNVNRTIRLVKY